MESARSIAYKILLDAMRRSTYSNIALDRELSRAELSDADKATLEACFGAYNATSNNYTVIVGSPNP